MLPDYSKLTGTSPVVTVTQSTAGLSPSLTGNQAQLIVEEKQPGLPLYAAQYTPLHTGPYSVAVSQLLRGGLSGQYFDNQWLLAPPALEQVDATVSMKSMSKPL